MKMNHHSSSEFVTQKTKLSKKESKIVFIPTDYLKISGILSHFVVFLGYGKVLRSNL